MTTSKTSQGVRNLNNLGPKRKREDHSHLDNLCIVGVHHKPSIFTEDPTHTVLLEKCPRCEAIINEDAIVD